LENLPYSLRVNDVQRAILEAVAAGRLSPEDAAVALAGEEVPDDPGTRRHDQANPSAPAEGPLPALDEAPARLLRVQAAGRHLRVVGDDTVDEVDVEGLHEVRREGAALVVTAHRLSGEGSFSFVGPPFGREGLRAWRDELRNLARQARRAERDAHRHGVPPWETSWGPGHGGGPDWMEWQRWVEPLVIRVNPELAVEIDVTAAACTLTGLRGQTKLDISAGTATLERLRGSLDLRAQAASVRVSARLTEGQSRVRCDAGSVVVELEEGSDVTVRTQTELGRVRLRRAGRPVGGGAGVHVNDELVVGEGHAALDVDAVMGSVEIRADERDRGEVPW
jgi:hypothetical protein